MKLRDNIQRARSFFCLLLAIFVLPGCISTSDARLSGKELLVNSVVRVSTVTQSPSYYRPWRWLDSDTKSGQGLVVGKNLVLTLASNVANAKRIEVMLNTEPVPTTMEVVACVPNSNLALLKGELPPAAQPVAIPASMDYAVGDELRFYWKTSTGRLLEGTAEIDRIESYVPTGSMQHHAVLKMMKASHSEIGYGVPVFNEDGLLAGLALNGGSEDYEFPVVTVADINQCLDIQAAKARQETGIAGFGCDELTQQLLREKLGVPGEGGCLVTSVYGQGTGATELKKGDVLLEIDGHQLDAWGRYSEPHGGLLYFKQVFSEHCVGDEIAAKVIRDGVAQEVALPVATIDDSKWLIRRLPKRKPTEFFVRGGFVFQPLTRRYVCEWGGDYYDKVPLALIVPYDENLTKVKSDEQQQLVVLSHVLAHPLNRALQGVSWHIVREVNGVPVKNLRQLKEMLDDPNNAEKISLGLDSNKTPLILIPKYLKQIDREIQQRYGLSCLERFYEE